MTRFEKIIKGPHPILEQYCAPVVRGENLDWLDELETVARKCKSAAGLAAPQIGVTKRAFFMLGMEGGTIRGRIIINPIILDCSDTTEVAEEQCLSFPGVTKSLSRLIWIKLRYFDRDFREWQRVFDGFAARIVQHEIDHLNGICKVGDDRFPDEIDLRARREKLLRGAVEEGRR